MSKAMDNIKEELKTLYPDKNLTDNELEKMAKKLVSFFELGLKMRYQYGAEYVWRAENKQKSEKISK